MPSSEDWMTCKEVSAAMGGAVSSEFVRSATYRAKELHPLPCLKFGRNNKQRRINWGTFQRWLHEEEERCVSL